MNAFVILRAVASLPPLKGVPIKTPPRSGSVCLPIAANTSVIKLFDFGYHAK